MKTTVKSAIAILAVFLLVASCSNPFAGKDKGSDASTGTSLRLVFDTGLGRLISPEGDDIAASIALYGVRLSSAGKVDISATANVSGVLTLDNLAPGFWDLTVQALNWDDQVVARGMALGVEVVAGSTAEASVTLQYDKTAGYGDVEITVYFPSNLGIDSAVATLRTSTTLVIPVQVEPDLEVGREAWSKIDIVKTRISAGAPLLSVTFKRNGVVLGTMNELVWVFRNLPTRATRELTDAHFGKPPSAPKNLAVTQLDSGALVVSWTPTSVIADSYHLERADANGIWETLDSGIGPGTQNWMDANVQPGTTYRYRIKAQNRFGTSAWAEGLVTLGSDFTVYLGYVYNNITGQDEPVYWINGQMKALEPVPMGYNFIVNAMTVYAGNIYVAGAYCNTYEAVVPVYWVNGKAVAVNAPLGFDTWLTGIAVNDTGIYLVGNSMYSDYQGTFNTVLVWQNGIMSGLVPSSGKTPEQMFFAREMQTEGTDVYITGYARDMVMGETLQLYEPYPFLWKNGVLQLLNQPDQYSWETYLMYVYEYGYRLTDYSFMGMTVSGGVVTIAANFYSSEMGYRRPAYWIIGTQGGIAGPYRLDLDGAEEAELTGMSTDGRKVYFSGMVVSNSSELPAYWNGPASVFVLPSTNGASSWTSGIAVSGVDVYVLGGTSSGSGPDQVVVWKNGWLQAPIACDSDAWGDRILIAGDTALSGSVPGQGAITVDTSDLAPQLSIVGLGQGLFVDLPFEFSSSIGGEVTLLSLRDPYGENVILYDLAYSGGATVSANTSGMDSGWCTLTMRVVKNGIRYTTNQEVFFRQVAIGGIEEWGYYYPEDLPLTVFANIRTADSYTLWLFDDYDPGDPGVELSALPGEPYAFQLTSITLGSRQNCRLELEVTRDGATVSSTLYFDYYPEGGY